jgi:hypothetical protein
MPLGLILVFNLLVINKLSKLTKVRAFSKDFKLIEHQ